MSNFYYCDSCKKPVDLKHKIVWDQNTSERQGKIKYLCKECGGTNWHAMIDSPGGYPKIHPGSTHRVGDIEKLNHSKEILKIFGIGKE